MDEHVVVYGNVALHREVRKLNPRIRIMPKAVNAETVTRLIEELTPRVIAFDARDLRHDVIAPVKQAKLDIYVDRLGPHRHFGVLGKRRPPRLHRHPVRPTCRTGEVPARQRLAQMGRKNTAGIWRKP